MDDPAEEVARKIVAAQAMAFASWAVAKELLIETVRQHPDPMAHLEALFERVSIQFDHSTRDRETEMLALARQTAEGMFGWARREISKPTPGSDK